jgi:hypothetical protein
MQRQLPRCDPVAIRLVLRLGELGGLRLEFLPIPRAARGRAESGLRFPENSRGVARKRTKHGRWREGRQNGCRKFRRGAPKPNWVEPRDRVVAPIDKWFRMATRNCLQIFYPPTRNARAAPTTSGPTASRSCSRSRRIGTRSSNSGFSPINQACVTRGPSMSLSIFAIR